MSRTKSFKPRHLAAAIGVTIAAVVFAVIAVALLRPAQAADIEKGKALAERWCASCHAVSAQQTRASTDAPSFASIAQNRRIPEITSFLTQSHPSMPDMSLTTQEITDLIAYMQTQGKPLDPLKPPVEKDNPPRQYRG